MVSDDNSNVDLSANSNDSIADVPPDKFEGLKDGSEGAVSDIEKIGERECQESEEICEEECEQSALIDDEVIESEISLEELLKSNMNNINANVSQMREFVSAYLTTKEIVAALSADIRDAVKHMRRDVLESSMKDVIILREECSDIIKELSRVEKDMTPKEVAELMKSFRIRIDKLLRRSGVLIYSIDEFDPKKHEPIQVVITNDETLDLKIAEKMSDGYSINDNAIYPQRVKVYKYEKLKE